MKILCDIDDTILINDSIHPRTLELISKHDVILYSSSPAIKYWGIYFNIPVISKESVGIPKADVLIDDQSAFNNKNLVDVQYYFNSINDFFNYDFHSNALYTS